MDTFNDSVVVGNFVCIASILIFAHATIPAWKKPEIYVEHLATLQQVKSVFVDGNSESADEIRVRLESWTYLVLTNNKSQADAIISVEERI